MARLNEHVRQYPWVKDVWDRTVHDLDNLHHGLLITGVPGSAKREFVMALGQVLLCNNLSDAQLACGHCQNCILYQAGTHPDFHLLTTNFELQDNEIELVGKYSYRYHSGDNTEKRATPRKVISVDQIRLLIDRFFTRAHVAGRKIALILPADRMNINAANALLKLLEEPPADSILMLLSAFPGELPATIRSRCMKIDIPVASDEVGMAWLQNHMSADEAELARKWATGGPLDALKAFKRGILPLQEQFLQGIAKLVSGKANALDLAAKHKQHDFIQWLDWLHRFSCELIRWSYSAVLPGWHGQICLNVGQLPTEKIFAFYDRIGYYKKIAREQCNEQLAMEELMLTLHQILKVAIPRNSVPNSGNIS